MTGHSRPKDGVACARLCPAIHALATKQDVDARHKAGHDSGDWCNRGETLAVVSRSYFGARPFSLMIFPQLAISSGMNFFM